MQTRYYDLNMKYEEGLTDGAKTIAEGGLVAFPTETVYGLGADAENDAAVLRIFEAKGRPQDNPLIVHVAQTESVLRVAKEIPQNARLLMEAYWPGPLTLILKKREGAVMQASGGLETVGVRMPDAKAARDLILRSKKLIAAPSANLSGKPSPTCARDVVEDFEGKVPVVLDGGPARFGVESTVLDLTKETPVILRPGAIDREMIAAVTGVCTVSPAVLHELAQGEAAPSPGMKYKHYAPRARVVVVEADTRLELANKIKFMYDKILREDGNPVIFCSKRNAPFYERRNVWVLGESEREIASSLFAKLREADRQDVSEILFEAVNPEGIGLAVMNRIIRAAGFNIF